jgi:hypothetical protein
MILSDRWNEVIKEIKSWCDADRSCSCLFVWRGANPSTHANFFFAINHECAIAFRSLGKIHRKTFSRMRTEGFLFSFLGVWGWCTVCGSFSFCGSLILSPRCLWGMWKKVMFCDVWRCISRGMRRTLWHSGKSCFATLSNYVAVRCLWGKWKRVMFCDVRKCISRGKCGTFWHSGKNCFAGL